MKVTVGKESAKEIPLSPDSYAENLNDSYVGHQNQVFMYVLV
jgi:hypothetical protein